MKKFLEKIFLILPIPVFIISLILGGYFINFPKIIDIILYQISGYTFFGSVMTPTEINIIWNIRLPRIILVSLVGASLSVSGATFQSILRNPLVDPYILGISSASAFGAALSMAFLNNLTAQLSAFVFACIGVLICYGIAINKNRQVTTISLILAGVLVASIFSSLLAIVQLLVEPLKLQGILYWTMGSFHTANWQKVYLVFPSIVISLIIMFYLRWKLNILSLGDKEAKSLGINPERFKVLLIIIATILTSSAVSVSGVISLVGLIVPHIIRIIFGPDNRKVIPISITFGSTYLMIVDNFSRNLMTSEIPIGIFTTLLGAPFFAYLLKQNKGGFNDI